MNHLRKHQWPLHDCIILQCGIYAKAAITDIFISDFFSMQTFILKEVSHNKPT